MEKSDDAFKTPCSSKISSVSSRKDLLDTETEKKELGLGTGVVVYLLDRATKFKRVNASPWAVKQVNKNNQNKSEVGKRLIKEADILRSLDHPNIIGFRSFEGKKLSLCMEFGEVCLTSLMEERDSDSLGPFSSQFITNVSKCIASGLKYLHTEKYLLHGDIKSGNVLIKGSEAKLCDFGVALKLDKNLNIEPSAEYIGTECWCPPEFFQGGQISHKSDIFPYGLVIWEMIALDTPHIKLLADESEETEAIYLNALGTRPDLPDIQLDNSYDKVIKVFNACTEEDPEDRPSAAELLDTYLQ